MIKTYPYSNDSNFLLEIDGQQIQEQYVRIIILNWKEEAVKEIQGIVTGGTLSLNGSSALRSTLNLNATIPDNQFSKITDANNLFSINKKIYLEVGCKNTTSKYSDYPIIWFPQGYYVISGCSLSHSLSGLSLSLQIKDKMATLNGECGGIIPASVQLDKYDTIDENGNIIISKPTIDQIIVELVNHFGGEQLGKIVVSDIDKRIKTVMRWIGNTPVYQYNNGGSYFLTTDYEIAAVHPGYKMFTYGDDIGYIYSDFTYNGDLIADAGSSVCDQLEKIKNYLGGNYEYFYDINGVFRFQEIKNFLNTTQATIEIDKINNNNYVIDMTKGKSVYNFTNSPLITSYSNNPQYNNVKNDYVVWGMRKNAEGRTFPIRYHLAIDTKPKIGNIYDVFFYTDPDDGLTKAKMPIQYKNFAAIEANDGVEGIFYQDTSTDNIYIWNGEQYILADPSIEFVKIKTTDWRSELYLQGVAAEPLGLESNYYFSELANEWPKLYNLKAINKGDYYEGAFYPEVLSNPWDIDFFLDFIDSNSQISQFNVDNIGRRSIVESKDDFNCVFEPEIPDFVLIELGTPETAKKRQECEKRNQAYIQVDSNIYSMIATGGIHNSCFNEVKNLLWQKTNYNTSITLNAIPIFHLEPNTRITVESAEDDIHGDFIINNLSIPLAVNGSMNISATQAGTKL